LALHAKVVLHLVSLAFVSLSVAFVGFIAARGGSAPASSHALVAIIQPSLPLVQLSVSRVHCLLEKQRTLVLSARLRRQ
jgi:hypothetical protein